MFCSNLSYFYLDCQKDKKNVTKLLTDANRDIETFKTAVSNFNVEKQGAKNDSDSAIERFSKLLSTCQDDFSNLTQVCQGWEKRIVDQGKNLAEKDTLIAKRNENLKDCEWLVGEKDTNIGTLESDLKNCNRDLNSCTNFVAKTETDQLNMVNQLRDDLHYAGIYSNCCAEKTKLRCNAEMLAARYTCLPIYLLEDTCFEGSSQGQELWDISQCLTLSDKSLIGITEGSFAVDFITGNPKLTTIFVALILFALVGFGTSIHFLISICCKKFGKSLFRVRENLVPEDPDLGQSSPPVVTPSVTNDEPGNPANETSEAASGAVQDQMNEDIRAAELACGRAYSTVQDFLGSSGEGATGLRVPDHPSRPSRLRPPSYEFLARQAQVRLNFSYVLSYHSF